MKLAFAMLDMPHWHEVRERGVCFENLYDTLYGYSYCFDPYLLAALGDVPALIQEAALRERLAKFDLLLSPERQVTAALFPAWPADKPALWADPPPELAATLCAGATADWVQALREKLVFAEGQPLFFLSQRLLSTPMGFWAFQPQADDRVLGRVGERPFWLVRGNAAYGSVNNPFRLNYLHYSMATQGAFVTNLIRTVFTLLGRDPQSVPLLGADVADLRRDFHAFGACLALLEYGLLEGGYDPAELCAAHAPLLTAARAFVAGSAEFARAGLQTAFTALYEIRRRHFPFVRGCIDIPHAGILAADGGLAELEWPEYTRTFLSYMADLAESLGYRFSLEYNVGGLVETARRHPEIIARLGRLWLAGKIDFVNGSWAGPLQQYSDIDLAAREFELGQEALEKLFGRRCESYACQEFSFLPSFPGLLRDFGYTRVAHITQNRGQVPETQHNHLNWRGKDGRTIPAVGHHTLDLVKRGVNFYIEWPTLFRGAQKLGIPRLDSPCMQDQAQVYLREEVVRAERYAPLFGEHVTLPDVLPHGLEADLPAETFSWDEYSWEQPCNGPICYHWISVFEQVLRYARRTARAETLAAAAGIPAQDRLRPAWEWVLYLESHDNELVPHGSAGDFYSRNYLDYYGPVFDPATAYFGTLMQAKSPGIEALLGEVETAALARLGLTAVSGGKPGRRVLLFNPFPQPLAPGGWFPWAGADFRAAGDGCELRSFNGRCYWSGTLAAGSRTTMATALRPTAGTRLPATAAWRVSPGPAQAVELRSPQSLPADDCRPPESSASLPLAGPSQPGRAGTTPAAPVSARSSWAVAPVDDLGARFRRTQLRHTADAAFAVSQAEWSCRRPTGPDTVVRVEFVQIAGCPLLFLHVEVTGYRPNGTDKRNAALRLRFTPTAGDIDGVDYFVSHFLEPSRKTEMTSSPYVARVQTRHGALALLNQGSLWYQNQGGAVDVAIMMPDERVTHRDLAVGWNLAQPIATAVRQLDRPLLVRETGTDAWAGIRVQVEPASVWVSSWRSDGVLRLSETAGRTGDAVLQVTPVPAGAVFLGERGRHQEPLSVLADGSLRVRLKPYESAAIRLTQRSP